MRRLSTGDTTSGKETLGRDHNASDQTPDFGGGDMTTLLEGKKKEGKFANTAKSNYVCD